MYARHANASYHTNKQKLDFFRRRKWRRPLKCVVQGHPAIFRLIRDRDRKKVSMLYKMNLDSNICTPMCIHVLFLNCQPFLVVIFIF